ncbi:uncharacterized protein LOC122025652 [Zingiber officinale]|uniref:uncharacterized protein LOC122025652 n=1 Tax=Zingiber officinale TaxID=94328 RepID=UPI001C4AF290|nr:uncharacterized protein LOC122025652 [Zingiber officinale]
MSSLGSGLVLEMAKFASYLAVPAAFTFAIAFDSNTTLHKLMGLHSYVNYPQEAHRPPSLEELKEMAGENIPKNN